MIRRDIELKAFNWKEFTEFTLTGKDGPPQMKVVSQTKYGSQSVRAGAYHPQFNRITTANSGGTSINKTINRVPVLDLLVHVLPFFSSPWLSPLLSVIASSLPLLLPFSLSTFSFV